MSLDTLEIRFERSRDTGHLRYRQRGLLRQWRSFFGTFTSWPQSSEEYGVADTMNLTRFNCAHAWWVYKDTTTKRNNRLNIADVFRDCSHGCQSFARDRNRGFAPS